MKRASFLAAGAVIVLANAFALLHVWRNRATPLPVEYLFTDRELKYSYNSLSADDDSGITLTLSTQQNFYLPGVDNGVNNNDDSWFGKEKLQSIGFDCSMDPESSSAREFYSRQRARTGYAAFEYDGPAWQAREERYRKALENNPSFQQGFQNDQTYASHLVAVDVDGDLTRLRSRNSGANILILPAVLGIQVTYPVQEQNGRPARPPRLLGRIQQVPTEIHVPRPFSEDFRPLQNKMRNIGQEAPLYQVSLHYGAALEPWITGVHIATQK